MAAFKNTLSLFLALSACISVTTFAAVDNNGAAQLETTPPPAEGPLTADQIPPLSLKTIMSEEKGTGDTGTSVPTSSPNALPPITAPSADVEPAATGH